MKALLRSLTGISAIFALPIFLSAQAAPMDVVSQGKQFVELLAKGEFGTAVTSFDATMKAALSEQKLQEAWTAAQAEAGAFKKQLEATATKVAGYDVVLVTCRFERKLLDVKVVFDAQGQVAGLFFVPSAAEPPPYARTDAFREVEFTVGRGEWKLPGTLTLPNGPGRPWPAVVLVHGSGPQDRDETIGANKPFRDLAYGLAAKGIAVLRYEKRTKAYPAKLAKGLGGFTVQEETIDDALTAVTQLRATDGINPKSVFVIGHSLGGMVIPRIAQADPQIAGVIMLAGCLSQPLEDIMVEQTRYVLSLKAKPSADEKALLAEVEWAAARIKKLTAADAKSSMMLIGAPPAYWLDLREHDPLTIARGLKQPLLILRGGRDYHEARADFEHWRNELKNQPSVTFKLYPKLNHLFVAGEGKSTPDEYAQAGHVAEQVVTDIAEWIRRR